ncbi:MAG: type 4a pilus biogenesis protein PilO [Deltaproteobacteria bacterium]|nr:type 4a pilus biogenesis protein PilO [Deltaproteobacteria bacterium]
MKSSQILNTIRFNKFFWIVFGLIVICNLLFHMTIGKYQKKRIDELHEEYLIKRMVKAPQKNIDQVRFLQARRDIQSFVNRLSQRTEFPVLVSELFQLLHRHGLSMDKMSYHPESIDFYDLLKFTTNFSVVGKYAPIKAFLADLQESKTFFCIDNLSITNRSSQDEESIEMAFQVSMFFR